MDKYIGFDIDDKKTVACIVQQGEKDMYETIPTDVECMKKLLQNHRKGSRPLHLTFEVSGRAGWLYDELLDTVSNLQVCNPSEMTWIYRTKKKTDRIDARKMAYLSMMGVLPTVHMPKKVVRQWRQRIQHRRKLVSSTTRVKNQIRTLIKNQGLKKPGDKQGWWSKATRIAMQQLCDNPSEDWTYCLEDLLEQLELHEKQVVRVTKQLDEKLSQHPGGPLLQTIPGVGPRTAEAILAYTDNIERFRRGKDYASYFGMTPKLDQSGQMRRDGHISKQGPSVVRWLIVESAWRAIQHNKSLNQFYQRVLHGQKNRKKIAIVATARKMLTIMRAMLLTGEVFNENLVLKQEQCPKLLKKVV